MFPRVLYHVLLCSVLVFAGATPVFADHSSPERIVDGKYTVILSLDSDGESMRLKFFFRDSATGRNLDAPIAYRFFIQETNSVMHLFESPRHQTATGVGENLYAFPKGGLYEISLEFELANEPGKVYRPEHWSIWAPGAYERFGERYPIGFSEIAGFVALGTAILLFLGSLWWHKKTGRHVEFNVLKWFKLE